MKHMLQEQTRKWEKDHGEKNLEKRGDYER
ncbi:MAG: hypothetical protein JSC189_000764 [Candidatus Tokpelaia sp. JSC189]|nr:MAG: hypothetical protein JSC189_000764 [Candidatus Tokpelaia sp. JSC189]